MDSVYCEQWERDCMNDLHQELYRDNPVFDAVMSNRESREDYDDYHEFMQSEAVQRHFEPGHHYLGAEVFTCPTCYERFIRLYREPSPPSERSLSLGPRTVRDFAPTSTRFRYRLLLLMSKHPLLIGLSALTITVIIAGVCRLIS